MSWLLRNRRDLLLIAAILLAGYAAWNVYLEAGRPILGDLPGTEINRSIPATGEQGFNVEGFCQDKLTTVDAFLALDASGETYQILRVKDGVTESVIAVVNPRGETVVANHYYQEGGVQKSEAAFLTDKARDCLARKSR